MHCVLALLSCTRLAGCIHGEASTYRLLAGLCMSYSGMLPGFVSGFYTYDECHIDLARLTSWAKARLIHAEASGIDTKVRLAFFTEQPQRHDPR